MLSPAPMTRRERAAALLRGGPDTTLSRVPEPEGSASAAYPSCSVREECAKIMRLALLVYNRSNKRRRRRADLWLGRGKLLQCVRFLLDVETIVLLKKSKESPLAEFMSFEDDETEPPPLVAAEQEDRPIKVPTLSEVTEALGLPANRSGFRLAEKRDANRCILRLALKLINEQGDSHSRVGASLQARQARNQKRKRAADDEEFHLKTKVQDGTMRHSRSARKLPPSAKQIADIVCSQCKLGTDAFSLALCDGCHQCSKCRGSNYTGLRTSAPHSPLLKPRPSSRSDW